MIISEYVMIHQLKLTPTHIKRYFSIKYSETRRCKTQYIVVRLEIIKKQNLKNLAISINVGKT